MYDISSKWDRVKRGPYITYLFLGIQLVVFLLMELKGISQGEYSGSENIGILQQFGAMTSGDVIYRHQYWRFITPIFIHIGLMHLAVNSLTLYLAGRILEPLIGHWRFFTLYLLSGIMGNFISFAFSDISSISAGASTSLFGMFAAFIILGRMFPKQPVIRQMSQNMILLIVMNLVLNLFDSGVDIYGHIGGAVGGLLLMLILRTPKSTKSYQSQMNPHLRIISVIIFTFILFFSFIYGFRYK
ncbi:rhomboid family intramembrane serine protease [Vagococcus vulneris]|uniref:Peptidase S54 rhomboid domain-containing protein n=1 Tax=Vagococcus vulneris TaxID=1977869 RepID=A0A429ZZQ0_9ENTE|nr:rhomboid family intramembrane serine protease [Vagococcus vulneris]RST99497.1 hypothetical protein CBF37_04010 [Vagococcus vulneris]